MGNTVLIGKAKELFVATLLVSEQLHVYFPLVDSGFDLVVSNAEATEFVPVQVKYKNTRTGFALKRADADKFAAANAVIAFGSHSASLDHFYFFPAQQWFDHAIADDRSRADDKLVVYGTKPGDWAEEFRGAEGLKKAFRKVLPAKPA